MQTKLALDLPTPMKLPVTYAPTLPALQGVAPCDKLPADATVRMVIGPDNKRYASWTCSDTEVDPEIPVYEAPPWMWMLVSQAEREGFVMRKEVGELVRTVGKLLDHTMSDADDKSLRESLSTLKNYLAEQG